MSAIITGVDHGVLPTALPVEEGGGISLEIRHRLDRGDVVEYRGTVKARQLMGINKTRLLGSGCLGRVYAHQTEGHRVVKKILSSYQAGVGDALRKEHRIGRVLTENERSPCNFLRVYGLLVKTSLDPGSHKPKYRLLMEKIEGVTLHQFMISGQKLDNAKIRQLAEQLLDCCLYLHEQEICWDDTHDANLMLDQIDSSPRLRVLDYGGWYFRSEWKTEDDTDSWNYFAQFIQNTDNALTNTLRAVGFDVSRILMEKLPTPDREHREDRAQEHHCIKAYFAEMFEYLASSDPSI